MYGIVRPNEKKTIRLIFKGLGGKQCPTKDHYTCVLAATTSSNVRPELVWKQHRCQTQMADSSMIKRMLKVGMDDAYRPRQRFNQILNAVLRQINMFSTGNAEKRLLGPAQGKVDEASSFRFSFFEKKKGENSERS